MHSILRRVNKIFLLLRKLTWEKWDRKRKCSPNKYHLQLNEAENQKESLLTFRAPRHFCSIVFPHWSKGPECTIRELRPWLFTAAIKSHSCNMSWKHIPQTTSHLQAHRQPLLSWTARLSVALWGGSALLHSRLGPFPSLPSPQQQQAKHRQAGNCTGLPVRAPADIPLDTPSPFLLTPIKGNGMKWNGYLGPYNASAFIRLW